MLEHQHARGMQQPTEQGGVAIATVCVMFTHSVACRIVKLVRALRKGWIQTTAERAAAVREKAPAYLLWQDDGLASDKTLAGASCRPLLCSDRNLLPKMGLLAGLFFAVTGNLIAKDGASCSMLFVLKRRISELPMLLRPLHAPACTGVCASVCQGVDIGWCIGLADLRWV